MSRKAWIIAGMVLATPFLLFTGLLALIGAHALLLAAFPEEWSVENQTTAPVWVTPLGVGGRVPVPLPHYATRWATYSSPPYGELLVQPGERRKFHVDGYAMADVGGPPGVVVRTPAGDHRYCKGTFDGQTVLYVLDNLTSFASAS